MDKKTTAVTDIYPIIERYLQKLQRDHLQIERVILFGSRVKGMARKDSDIDLCIISPQFANRMDAFDYLWSKRDRKEILHGLEPIGYPPSAFIDEDPLVWEIKKTGIRIPVKKIE